MLPLMSSELSLYDVEELCASFCFVVPAIGEGDILHVWAKALKDGIFQNVVIFQQNVPLDECVYLFAKCLIAAFVIKVGRVPTMSFFLKTVWIDFLRRFLSFLRLSSS